MGQLDSADKEDSDRALNALNKSVAIASISLLGINPPVLMMRQPLRAGNWTCRSRCIAKTSLRRV